MPTSLRPTRRDRPTPAASRPAASALDSLRRLVRALRTASAGSERERGITAAQAFALRQIAARPGQSLGELAERALASPSSMSEVASRLIASGLVRRETSDVDRRRAVFSLTPAGRATVDRTPETIQERLVAAFATLPAREQDVMATGLAAWLAAAGLADTPATMFLEPTTD